MVKSKNITAPKAKDTANTPWNLKRFSAEYLPFRKEEYPVSLDSLIQGPPNDIENLMSSYSIHEQVQANENYVKEIDEEILEES